MCFKGKTLKSGRRTQEVETLNHNAEKKREANQCRRRESKTRKKKKNRNALTQRNRPLNLIAITLAILNL